MDSWCMCTSEKYLSESFFIFFPPTFLRVPFLLLLPAHLTPQEYRLASTHCYGRYLHGLRAEGRKGGGGGEEGGGEEWIVRYSQESSNPETVAFVVSRLEWVYG